jgi:serine phosphatase RsbU (regulator of sigma subunit)
MAEPPRRTETQEAVSSRLFTLIIEGPHSRAQAIGSVLIGTLLEVALMVILGLVPPGAVTGLPGPLAVAIAATVAMFAGLLAGLLVIAAGALGYLAFITDFGHYTHAPAVVASSLLWIALVVLVAVSARWVRQLLTARLQAQARSEELYRSLEQSLLPASVFVHPLLAIATYYLPGERGLRLGGDFFDFAALEDGSVALVIGDVSGHGPRAAALGAMLRGAWRGAVAEAAPSALAHTLDRIVTADGVPDSYATAFFAWIDAEGRSVRLLNAGHPPPLLIADEVSELAVEPQPPLGLAVETQRRGLTAVDLPPSWTLLFYTDGLTEMRVRPGASERVGVQTLRARLATREAAPDSRGLADLANAIAADSGEQPFDDIAAIAVHRAPPGGLAASRPSGVAEPSGAA